MTFQTGQSGNPNGRPTGSGSRQQIFNTLVEPHREALFKTAIDMALKGNEAMLRLFLERMIPAKPVGEPIQMSIADDSAADYVEIVSSVGKEVLRAVAAGGLTPDEAVRVSSLIGSNARLLALVDLNQRMKTLEQKK